MTGLGSEFRPEATTAEQPPISVSDPASIKARTTPEAERTVARSPRTAGPSFLNLVFDPGWLFVIAGLAICTAGLLIPAQRDLGELTQKLDRLRHEEAISNERLKSHTMFLVDLEREDPPLVRRLAASQLNLMPQGDRAVLLASTAQSPVTDWIDATVRVPVANVTPISKSTLSRLATGSHRLWMLTFGVICVFVGLLLDPSINRPHRAARPPAPSDPVLPHPDSIPSSDAAIVRSDDEPVFRDDNHEIDDVDLQHRAEQSIAAFNMAAAAGAMMTLAADPHEHEPEINPRNQFASEISVDDPELIEADDAVEHALPDREPGVSAIAESASIPVIEALPAPIITTIDEPDAVIEPTANAAQAESQPDSAAVTNLVDAIDEPDQPPVEIEVFTPPEPMLDRTEADAPQAADDLAEIVQTDEDDSTPDKN